MVTISDKFPEFRRAQTLFFLTSHPESNFSSSIEKSLFQKMIFFTFAWKGSPLLICIFSNSYKKNFLKLPNFTQNKICAALGAVSTGAFSDRLVCKIHSKIRKYETHGGRPGNPKGKSKNSKIREFLLKAIGKYTLQAIFWYNILIGLLHFQNHFWDH
jgi:hypothetical protein